MIAEWPLTHEQTEWALILVSIAVLSYAVYAKCRRGGIRSLLTFGEEDRK